MFLKRLEIVGFKSFAERIGIDFVPGVTAVVGPNGSGKSNVTDAIRWVLGEQSAKSLRGAKMEDVIFAGSDSRKPLNFAEVTLILDNEDEQIAFPYSEVNVTRRVYRSGDSEYLLNNQQCRLKDITDLFMDSGLGKEAFSIISQGKVDEILNSKPHDRRSIFEEAAGVLKYKNRKKKAEHKLVETDENLLRVLDILHELDVRLEPLSIQASSAKDYVTMTKELQQYDIALIVHDIKNNVHKLQNMQDEFERIETEENHYATNIKQIEKDVQKIRKQLKDIDASLDEAQEQLVEATSEVERWDGRRALITEKRQNASLQIDKLQASLIGANKQVETLEQQQRDKKQQFVLKQQALQQLKQQLKQLDISLNHSAQEIDEEIEKSKNIYIDLLNEEATLKNDMKNIEQQLVQHQETAARMVGHTNEIEIEIERVRVQKQSTESSLVEIEQQLSDQIQQQNTYQLAVKKLTDAFEQKQQMLYKAYQHHQQLKARRDTLQELEADFSGFFQGVKEILLARDNGQLAGIEGAVAELIQVNSQYSQAIETALGAATQHIVTQNEQHAQQAIAWLKSKRAGRATFLPKTVMKSRKIISTTIQAVTSHPAFVNIADEIVQFDEVNRTIVENLLGNVIVARTLEGASEIARLCHFKYRVVTLDGDIVNAGGSLTGGASKQQSSLFSRKAELDGLTAKIAELDTTIMTAEKTIADKKQMMVDQREQLEQSKIVTEQLTQTKIELTMTQRELESAELSLSARMSFNATEQSDATSRKQQLLQRQKQAIERLSILKQELTSVKMHVEQLNVTKLNSETTKDTLREQAAQKRSEIAVAQEQLTQLQVATSELALNLTNAQNHVEDISREITWIQSETLGNGLTVEEIEHKVVFWSQKKDELTKEVAENRQLRTNNQSNLTIKEQSLKELQHIYKGLVEMLQSLELQRNRFTYEIERLIHELDELYQLDYYDVHETVALVEDEEYTRKKVKLLKKSIEELGPVNLSAIEEYERVFERHVFLTEQRNDLLTAQQTLQTAIQEMDEEMVTRFSETFFSVKEQFSYVFRELFGGGKADLVLTNPDNMLETGIEIIAQPPGKKLQNLSLLSGGERALTAIALLFAILNTRPVPFCILDEVEAALDEANVTRYSQYLKKYSHQTQFIVITHRKGTMEGADVLYGITMQESGVSKLVSVKLENNHHEAE